MSTRPTAVCRSCGSAPLHEVLSLGTMPLANRFLERAQLNEPEPRFPLDLVFCPICTLVQITETVPPETMFTEYLYLSSCSDTMVGHARALSERIIATRGLGRTSLVVEVASNDGYLLRNYHSAGIPVLGIEPAANVATIARERHGIPTVSEFFGEQLADRLLRDNGPADVLHAHNVLAHVPDLNGFARGVRRLLKDDGIAIVEVPYVREMLANCEFDTIYHEHLCYFSVGALDALCRRADLAVIDAEVVPIHGGSLRLTLGATSARAAAARVSHLLEDESRWAASARRYQAFADQVRTLRDTLRELLGDLKGAGRRVAAYGAAAKGTVLLNFCEFGPETIDFVADRNPHKQGRFVPGVRIPVRPPEALQESAPDYALLLVWNIVDEVLDQQSAWRRNGGRFIVPVPHVSLR